MSASDQDGAGEAVDAPVDGPTGLAVAPDADSAASPPTGVASAGGGEPSVAPVEETGAAPVTHTRLSHAEAAGRPSPGVGGLAGRPWGGEAGMLPASPFLGPCSATGAASVAPQRSLPVGFRAEICGSGSGLSSPFSSGEAGLGISGGSGVSGDRPCGLAPGDPARLGHVNAHKRAISATVRQDFQYLPLAPPGGRQGGGAGARPPMPTGITRTRSAPTPPLPPEPEPKGQDGPGRREPELGAGGCARAAGVLCGGYGDIGQRRKMEDYFFAEKAEDAGVGVGGGDGPRIQASVGVFDGHNGPEAAQFACENFMAFLTEAYGASGSVASGLAGAFARCEAELFAAWRGGTFGDSGTTALVAVLTSDGALAVANAGDCRAVLSRGGRAEPLTVDHKPGCEAERCRILAAGGYLDNDDYLNGEIGVSRCIGDFHLGAIKKPEGGPGALIPDPELYDVRVTSDCEFLILGSDGLWDVLSNQRAVDLARGELDESRSAEKAAEKLVFEAKCKEGRDNITAALMVLRELPLPAKKSARRRFVNSRLRLNSRSLMDLKQALQSADAGPPPLGPF